MTEILEKIKEFGADVLESEMKDVYDIQSSPKILKNIASFLESEGFVNDSGLFGGTPDIIGSIRACCWNDPENYLVPGFMAFPADTGRTISLGEDINDALVNAGIAAFA